MGTVRFLLGLIGLFSLFGLVAYTTTAVPAEDAVILHQYSRNVAETGVISYIPGGPHAEGATDFLWMLYIAAAIRMHATPGIATAIANVVCALALASLLLQFARRKVALLSLLAVVGTLSVFPQVQAAMMGFCVLPFALAWVATARFALEGRDRETAIAALALCLIRPDGVIFAIPAIIALRLNSFDRVRAAGSIYSVLFFIPSLTYFAWRWWYFGELFPLPFLVKATEHRTLGLFIAQSALTALLFVAFAGYAVLGLYGREALKSNNARLLIVLFVVPSLFYANIRLEQDVRFRFFFYVPVGLAVFIAWMTRTQSPYEKQSFVLLGFAAAFLAVFISFSVSGLHQTIAMRKDWDRLRQLASDLGAPELRGTALVSEAGLFPYYSRWTPYDAWGLNTPRFAHHLIQPQEVIELHPDLAILNLDNIENPENLSDCTLFGSACIYDPKVEQYDIERGVGFGYLTEL